MTRRYIVPGRIELVGKHVDYAGGRSLTCAVDLALQVRAEPVKEPVIRARSSHESAVVEIALGTDLPVTGWGTYIAAVARRMGRDFPLWQTGVALWIDSDLPPSAGLSSSSALVVAVATALADVNRADQDPGWRGAIPNALARAEYCAAIETGAPFGAFDGEEGVGVRGGAQDPIAILCSVHEVVSQFSYLPGRLERRIPWPADHALVVAVSGVHATKTGNARDDYNRSSDVMRALVRSWNAQTGRTDETIAHALASAPDASDRLTDIAGEQEAVSVHDDMVSRLAQFCEESELIVPAVGEAIHDRHFVALGHLVDRSQALAEQVLGNQVPETIALARLAREYGAVAASAFGAGFGGAVWAMIPVEGTGAFVDQWRDGYISAFPERGGEARWIVTRPSGPAREVRSGS